MEAINATAGVSPSCLAGWLSKKWHSYKLYVKHCLDFSFVFSAPLPAGRNLFSARKGSSAVEDTSQAVLGSSNQQKVPVSLSVFLKSEKVPASKK
jgi:hypothetical protein